MSRFTFSAHAPRLTLLVTFLVLCFASSPLAADKAASRAAAAQAKALSTALDQRIDLSLTDATPGEVFAGVAEVLGVDLEIDDEVTRPITLEVSRSRVRHVLDILCDMADCQWRPVPGLLVVTASESVAAAPPVSDDPLDQPISIHLRGAAMCETLRSFGKFTDAEVVVSGDILCGETLTIAAEMTPVRAVLDEICRLYDCRWHRDDQGRLVFER